MPYRPSELTGVRKAFDAVKLGEEDILYDLGCGDGRVLFLGVVEYKVKKAVGVELREELISPELKRYPNIEVRVEDLHLTDFSDATVVYLYLGDEYNLRLREKLSKLRDARIISNSYEVDGWIPTQTLELDRRVFYVYEQ